MISDKSRPDGAAAPQGDGAPKPEYEIVAQFIKDLSFESPATPAIFFEKASSAPQIGVNLDLRTQKVGDELYEVLIGLKVSGQMSGKTMFVVDLSYGVIAAIRAAEQEKIQRYLTKSTPAHAFPFMRAIIAELTRESGFAPFVLSPIDFDRIEFTQTPAAPAAAPGK